MKKHHVYSKYKPSPPLEFTLDEDVIMFECCYVLCHNMGMCVIFYM